MQSLIFSKFQRQVNCNPAENCGFLHLQSYGLTVLRAESHKDAPTVHMLPFSLVFLLWAENRYFSMFGLSRSFECLWRQILEWTLGSTSFWGVVFDQNRWKMIEATSDNIYDKSIILHFTIEYTIFGIVYRITPIWSPSAWLQELPLREHSFWLGHTLQPESQGNSLYWFF